MRVHPELLAAVIVFSAGVRAAEERAFPEIYNTQEESIGRLSPAEALERMKLPPGFEATVFAAEPDVHQPIAMTFDSRGRLWVAENYTYSEAEVNFDTELRDRILIFEDSDGDGRFDERKVFWDEAVKLTSVAVGFGGVFATCPPRLLFIPDEDRDDVPDGAPEVLLDGFAHEGIRHTLANGLKFGPDGWLYGRHGIQGTSWVGKPGTSREERIPVNGSIWRFHPVRRVFEIVAQGTTNPWGSDWDEHGELFFINTVIGHLWHAVPGAYFKRMYGEPFNQYVYEEIEQVADHVHWDTREAWHDINKGMSATTREAGGGHAHTGLMIYQGDNWPAEYRGAMFTLNFHGKRINSDRIERSGATYVGRHGADFMSTDDPWFRGIELLSGPKGAVYVADWSDIGECHDNNGIHRSSGRIYRISYGEPKRGVRGNLREMDGLELVKLLSHRNAWHARQARQILQERAARGERLAGVREALLELFENSEEAPRKLRALWALYGIGAAGTEFLLEQLRDGNEHVRVWAIRLLADDGRIGPAALERFERMARKDESGLVLTYLASALQRIPARERWELALALAGRGEFEGDRVFPFMVWYGVEAAVGEVPGKAAALIEKSRLALVRELAARRVFEDLEGHVEAADGIVRLLRKTGRPAMRLDVLRGMQAGLEGVRRPAAPASWARVAPGLIESADLEIRSTARELDALFGNRDSRAALAGILADDEANLAVRERALEVLLQARSEGLNEILPELLDEPALALQAIRALGTLGQPDTPELLLGRFEELSESARGEVVNALVSRPRFAEALLEAVARGRIPREAVSPAAFRQLRAHEDAGLKGRIAAIWPRSEVSAEGTRQQFARYEKLLTPERLKRADLRRGRAVYQQACGACHKLYGEGAEIGPELTGSDRRNLDYLLENILTPSAIVPDGYRISTVNLSDERVLSGIVSGRTDEMLRLQTVSELVTLPLKEVDSVQPSRLSMMPEGLLEGLNKEQLADLFGYLMSRHPVAGQ